MKVFEVSVFPSQNLLPKHMYFGKPDARGLLRMMRGIDEQAYNIQWKAYPEHGPGKHLLIHGRTDRPSGLFFKMLANSYKLLVSKISKISENF